MIAIIATATTAARNASEPMNAEKMPVECPVVTVPVPGGD
jgi:hypothetical protein